jgi:NAD+ synthase (glutamine-hydrolysing)
VPQLRLALAQLDTAVGDLAGNAAKIRRWVAQAAAAGAQLVAFPELALTGYPVEDLALRRSFVEASRTAVHRLAADLDADGLGGIAVVVGYLDALDADLAGVRPLEPGVPMDAGGPQNRVAVLWAGRVATTTAKQHLPNYGVFDEERYFVPGRELTVLRLHGVDIALAICEDLWHLEGRVAATGAAGAGLLLVVNGSPYESGKGPARLQLVREAAAGSGATVAYLNKVGGQDELVFDGQSLVLDSSGALLARAPQFEEGSLVVDLELAPAVTAVPGPETAAGLPVRRVVLAPDPLPAWPAGAPPIAPVLGADEEVYRSLVTGLRSYVRGNRFRSVVLALSGGIDSALVAALAVDAVGADAVYAVALPSEYSSAHSLTDAEDLARRTGLHYSVIPIAPMVSAFLDTLHLTGVAEENLQSRVRGTTVMGLSNAHGHLVLATGNKSELAVGYSTIYGDAVGGFAPLKDVPKTLVWALARWRNKDAEQRGEMPPIPENSISKPPSAELAPGQVDTDSLPPYEILDALLDGYVVHDLSVGELVDAGFERELVERIVRLVDGAEWKRRQYPPGPKISIKAFGRDRRLPITNAWREGR